MSAQYRFYHYPICPFSRKIRFLLAEKDVSFIPIVENFWEKREKFCLINPTGEVPFLAVKTENDKSILIFSHNAITYYLEQKYNSNSLIFGDIIERTEIYKMCEWFDVKFYNEISKYLLNERIYSWYKSQKQPDLQLIRLARLNLTSHLNFIANILSKRDFIAGNQFSLADITCACHLSSLDYLGEINWSEFSNIKEWYMIIKSKPSFRDILYDSLPGLRPSTWYRELDF